MAHTVGEIITATVTDENDMDFFAQVDGVTYAIDKRELEKPLKVGGMVTGFAYENDRHQLQITKNVPEVRLGHYAWGTVTDIRRDLGVFVDIGLPNKDLALSLDELPTIKELWPRRGDKLMVTLRIDNKDRLWAELAAGEVMQAIRVPAKPYMRNQNLKATVYRLKMVGTLVLTEHYQLGFIHPSERNREPRLGEEVDVRVIGVREDGNLNLSMRPRNMEALSEDAQMILTLLQRSATHTLPYNDKSEPKLISRYFGMSKSQFKRAVGTLYKQRKITQDEDGLHLVEAAENEAN